MSVYCQSCGEEISEDAEICPECGVRQQTSSGGGSGNVDETGLQGNTLLNVIIGTVVGIIVLFIPVLNLFSSAIGGAVGGYLQKEGGGGGAKVGALISIAQLAFIGIILIVAGGLIAAALPMVGSGAGAAAGAVGLGAIVILAIPSLVLSIIGGAIGGAIGGNP